MGESVDQPGQAGFFACRQREWEREEILEVRDECETESDREGEDQALPSRGKRNDVGEAVVVSWRASAGS